MPSSDDLIAAESGIPTEAADPPAGEPKWFVAGLAVVSAVALLVRVAFVLIRQSSVELVTGDAYWYHFQAKLVAEGKGFLHPFDYFKDGIIAPGADHPPGFVLILAALDVIGIDTPQGQRLVMCVLGTASVVVIALLARRLAGPVVGLIAAAIAAVYPNMWINDGMLMVETVYILATAVALLCCYRYLATPTVGWLVGVSVALTVGAMHRPEALAVFGLLVLPMVLARRNLAWRSRIVHLSIAALIPVAGFAPWAVYNLTRFEAPVLLSTGAGQTLAAGNCDLTYSGKFLGFYDTNCLLEPQIVPPTERDRSLRDGQYREIALDYMSEHRSELPKVVAARVGRVWHLFRPGQSIGLDGFVEGRAGGAPGGDFRLVREALWGYYVLMPLAIGGLVLLRRRGTAIYPLLAQPILVTITAAATFGITRYRAGAEITVVLAAAVALGSIASHVMASRDAPAPVTPPDDTPPDDTPPNDTAPRPTEDLADGR